MKAPVISMVEFDTGLLDVLRARLGAKHVIVDPADMAGYLVEERKLYRGTAMAVVRPGSTEEVAFVVRECAKAGVAIVPQGGNTGLVGGGVPHRGIVLSLARLDRIREVNAFNATITAEAGCILKSVQDAAEGGGLHLPPVARLRGLLPDRRQHRDQCGRRERAALRQYPRPRARARSGARGRADLERSQGSAQGQYGLRPEEPLHRVGRDARHHHRRGAEAVSAAQDAGGRLRRLRLSPCGARPLREPAPARRRRADGLRVHAALRARDRAQACPRRHSSACRATMPPMP